MSQLARARFQAMFNGAFKAFKYDNEAIASFAGPAAQAGTDVYGETRDGGTASGAGVAGGLFDFKTGDGSAGATGVGNAGGAGGALNLTTGDGKAVGTAASGTANGGAGGAMTLKTGSGGGGGDSSGTDGSGGVLTLQTGAKGTGGSSAGIDGTIDLKLGGIISGKLANASITAYTAAAATAGAALYLACQKGGTASTAGKNGGLLDIGSGAASNGAAGTGNAGGVGGAITLTTGAGGNIGTAASGTANGGAGGALTLATGAGGGGGDSSGTDGNGGVLTLKTGAKGSGGSAAGIDGTIDLSIGGIISAKIANAAVTDYTAAADTVGAPLYIEGQKAGTGATAGKAGGLFQFTAGAGSTGASGQVGGAGGAFGLAAGAGAAPSAGSANGGAGGVASLVAGAGGAAGASGGTGGLGGDVTLTPGAAGGAGGGSIGETGSVLVTNGFHVYIGTKTAIGTTKGTNGLVFKAGTAIAGTIATSCGLFTDGTTLKKIIADGTVSDVQT